MIALTSEFVMHTLSHRSLYVRNEKVAVVALPVLKIPKISLSLARQGYLITGLDTF